MKKADCLSVLSWGWEGLDNVTGSGTFEDGMDGVNNTGEASPESGLGSDMTGISCTDPRMPDKNSSPTPDRCCSTVRELIGARGDKVITCGAPELDNTGD